MSALLKEDEVNHVKECIVSMVQRGHDMFQDSNPFLANIHTPR